MKVLLGTTNPSKVKRFSDLLKDCDIEFITLKDLAILDEPEENGSTPKDNAIQKALFYGQYFDLVICNDSGLYFECLPLDDKRQPGLNVRTPMNKPRLSDQEMLEYYIELVSELGGKISAYYLDGIAVYNHGKVYAFMDQDAAKNTGSFYMINQAAPKYFPGWPLDSISINKDTGQYFVDGTDIKSKENIIKGEYEKNIIHFLKKSLNIN